MTPHESTRDRQLADFCDETTPTLTEASLRQCAAGRTSQSRKEQLAAIRALDTYGIAISEGEADEAAEALWGLDAYATQTGNEALVGIGLPFGARIQVVKPTFTAALLEVEQAMTATEDRRFDDSRRGGGE